MQEKSALRYSRILLKLSGEAFMGEQQFGIDPKVLTRVADEIGHVVEIGVEMGLVIGGGNFFRGASLNQAGLGRVTADQMGMLATIMNSLAMADALKQANIPTIVMSAIPMTGMLQPFDHFIARARLAEGYVVIFAGGTGNPFFTTDSAACLRGIEIEADLVLKATKVDGVYSADPMVYSDAKRYQTLTYDEVIEKELAFMDLSAICLARDHGLPIRVFAMEKPGALKQITLGEDEGTLIQVG